MIRKKNAGHNGRQAAALIEESGTAQEAVTIRAEIHRESVPDSSRASKCLPVAPEIIPEVDVKPTDAAQKSNMVPLKFGSYELVWKICRDALSTTYAARKETIDRLLSIRIFNARVSDSVQIRNIQRAATKASELTHPNHVTVYENGVSETGAPYVVTDWVEGNTLAEVFGVTKRLDIARFLNIFNQVCEVLMEAHSRQLIHGNLSPNKIILTANDIDADFVKLIDFGMPPDPVQNAFYLSPEQCLDSNKIDATADIYSLGCIMYESLVGNPPFVGNKMSQAALNYLHELANQYSPDAPEHNALKLLDCIIIKCLQKKPSKRFRNIRELMDALRLVNDCICGGSKKKLPPKAEKLLLFRFLDIFDKKIVACMFAYLLLGLLSMKYIGELQLQKFIDEAQLARTWNPPLAQSYWRKAIQQAEWSDKPPSLKSALHWELGDALASQILETPGTPENTLSSQAVGGFAPQGADSFARARIERIVYSNNDLAIDAIVHYEQALQYFSKGYHYRSYALILLNKIAYLWVTMDNITVESANREHVVRDAQRFLARKQFSECARLCSDYLRTQEDKQLAYYAALAYNEYAIRLPAKKGLRQFERAVYYSTLAEPSTDLAEANLDICISNLKMDSMSSNTHLALGCAALESGDAEAAEGEFLLVGDLTGNRLVDACQTYQGIRANPYYVQNAKRFLSKAIYPLSQALAIEEEVYGIHSKQVRPTLRELAKCYSIAGQKQKAIDTYKLLFSAATYEGSYANEVDMLDFVDLLTETGHPQQALTELEKMLVVNGSIDNSSGLYVRLIKAYVDCKLPQQAHYAISQLILRAPEYVQSAHIQYSKETASHTILTP
jgi:serine/threonine protein kinase